MLRASLIFATLGIFILAGVQWTWVRKGEEKQRLLERRLEVATAENERLRGLVALREKARLGDRTKELRVEIERQVEEVRGLKFLRPVDYASVSRREIRAVFSTMLAEETTEEEFEHYGRAWARLGLLRKPVALRQTLLDLLSEQVAAFYDHRRHKLYMFEDARLETGQDQIVLAHELTHALQDQNFDLGKMPIALKTNDDRALAALSVIEGDATAVMTQFMAGRISMKIVLESATSLLSTQMEQLQRAPRILRERMLFPYLKGKDFCAVVVEEGGMKSLDRTYTRLPASTSQILHPEKFVSETPEEPMAIHWESLLLNQKAPTLDNVVGEHGVRVLLGEWTDDRTAATAAEGWRGDRYLSFAEEDALVWKSAWATPGEAGEFITAERLALQKRYGTVVAQGGAGRWEAKGNRVVRVVLEGEQIATVIDAKTVELADEMERVFAGGSR